MRRNEEETVRVVLRETDLAGDLERDGYRKRHTVGANFKKIGVRK